MKRTFTFLLTALFLCVGMVKAAVTDVPEMSTEGNTVWYTISNTRSVSGKYLYWTEAGLKDANTLSKASLFYFTAGGADTCYIHNAATDLLFTGDGAWSTEGVGCVISETPHSSKAGVAIEFNGTALNEQNHADGFTTWSANDAGSIFVISPVVATIKEAVAKIEENKVAGNTIFGQYKYEEESYNALVAALAVLESAEGEEFFAAFESSAAVMASLVLAMPEEGKFYVIECPLFKQVQGVSKALNSTPGWNTLNLTDKNYYWTVEVNDGSYALKNVATGKYLNGTSMSDAPAYAKLNSLGQQQFNIVVNGTTVHANNHASGKGGSGNIVSWGGEANSASAWQFIERVDPATLVEATVTYSFTYEGEEKYTQTTTTLLGEEWPDITVAFPYGVSASKPEGVVEAEKAAPTTFYVKNALSGQYLSYDVESNLTVAEAEAVATIVPSSVVSGAFAVSYPGPNGAADPRFVQCGSKGRFSGNKDLTENSSVYLYKVTGEGAATRVNAVEDGASYVFVAKCSKADYEGYWMITNELTGEGADLRMIGVKASDELADEITFEVGDYSPVWTVGVAEVEEVAAAEFYVKNAVSGKYLDYDPESNLTTGDAEAVATIVPSSLVAGTFAISYPNPKAAAGVSYVQSGSSGRFSGNTQLTKNSSIYVYKVASESTATRVEAIEDGASYIFVSESTKGGYWMLTNEPYKSGVDLRMVGVKVSDELPGDEITYEQGAEFSPVWTVEAVKEEPAAVAFTKVIELEVAELPFVAAETAEGISKWYYATMHTNRPHYIKENAAGGIDWILETVGEAKSDSLLWGFVGNHFDGIKLINKGTGHAVVSTGGAAQMGDVASATTFILSGSSTGVAGGFCLKYPEGGQYLNASGTSVSSWGDPDAGSTFQLYTLPKEELTAFAAKFNELESLTEAYTSMYAMSAVQNQFFAVYDAVAPVKEAIENGTATSEEVVAATASMTEVIAFVLAMDAKYNEWKAELMACYEVQDTTVTENVAAVAAFSAVVDKHSMYQWMMPAESVEDFDALIAELVAARESFIAAANTPMTPEMEAFLAKYGELEMVTETCPSLWFISVLNEKFYELIDAGDALKAKLLTATAEELSAFGVLVDEFIAFAQSMDAKYNEWKAELLACYEAQDTTTTASEEAVAAFAEVVDKHAGYQYGMPATSVEELEALIAELVAARKAFVDDATGINNINVNVEAVIYDIHGRRVSTMEKGIYIVNGRKVIVK